MPAKSKKLTATQLNHLSALDLAHLLTNENQKHQYKTFFKLNPKLAAETFMVLSPHMQKKILQIMPRKQLAKILQTMPPDDRTALFEDLSKDTGERYLTLLPEEDQNLTRTLLSYPEDSVGRLMTPDYIAVHLNWTIEKALDHIRDYGHDSETIDLIYIVDKNNVLLDDVKIREFLFVPKYYTVDRISDKRFISLSTSEKVDNAIAVFKDNDRVALPVIDENGVLKGIVTVDDILRVAQEKDTEDVQMIGGTEALDAPYMSTPFFTLMSKRVRWLGVLFVGEIFTGTAMTAFEDDIAKVVILVLFLPLIISSGGNAGSQSSTLIIRALSLGELKQQDWWKVMRREMLSGLFLGAVLGVLGFIRVLLWGSFSNGYEEHLYLIATTVGFALVGVVMWGAITGGMLPLLLRRLNVDPAVASAPLVATLVDVIGIVIYFEIARRVLHTLIG